MAKANVIGKHIKFSKVHGEILSLDAFDNETPSPGNDAGALDGDPGTGVASCSVDGGDYGNFWIKDEAGGKHVVSLRRYGVPMSVGQKVTVVSAHVGSRCRETVPSVFFNHDARMCVALKSPDSLFQRMKGYCPGIAALVGRGVLLFVMLLAFGFVAIEAALNLAGHGGLLSAIQEFEAVFVAMAAVGAIIVSGAVSVRKVFKDIWKIDERGRRVRSEVADHFRAIVQSDGDIVR